MTPISREMVIRNKLGLHARAATKLVRLANQFDAVISVKQGTQEVNASSVMCLMLLASQQGKTITVNAVGKDAEKALDAIENLIQNRFDEDE
ncbi:HPr family phosphocarrier protein [Aliidiomarina maris]|uniref:HPr family phosphocarrier protein n=1 Tax=Aliidiomarina maris TaxID=531312 RepID=A0A327X204_9GAMM|nr:HPr family phosphocarrier protein [Aliidiomarina maris]MBA3987622.1 HPr family phosphocarrier protein [Idiomarina sp.]RAJ99248.1 HPr-like nitrogen-regulatory protein NPr [Aliidiomarina maris]RUO27609.1 HPr family phosphocarrier protein [Aliidiomarina maris]